MWSARVRQISREQHIDELMLLNHSEGFYENPEMVEFVRTAMLSNPHPQPPEAFARQIARAAATTCATGSRRSACRST